MGEADRSKVGSRRWSDVAAGSRVSSRHGAKSHTSTSPQTSTRLSPGGANGPRLFAVTRNSRKPAPVSRLEPRRFHSNEGHPPDGRTYVIGIGARAMGPEADEFKFWDDTDALRALFRKMPLADCEIHPGFFFEVAGRFDDTPKETRVGRTFAYGDGECHAEILISIEGLQLPLNKRRRLLAGLMLEGSEKLADKVQKKWPQYDAKPFLHVVREACRSFVEAPDPLQN